MLLLHSKTHPSTKRWQTRNVLLNAYSFMKKETEEAKGQVHEHYIKYPFEVKKWVEEATKVFQNENFKNSGTADKAWDASNVTHFSRQETQSPKLVIDDFNNVVIRRTIREFYLQERMSPTVPNCYRNWETGLMLRTVAVAQENWRRNLVFFEQHDLKYMLVSHRIVVKKYGSKVICLCTRQDIHKRSHSWLEGCIEVEPERRGLLQWNKRWKLESLAVREILVSSLNSSFLSVIDDASQHIIQKDKNQHRLQIKSKDLPFSVEETSHSCETVWDICSSLMKKVELTNRRTKLSYFMKP